MDNWAMFIMRISSLQGAVDFIFGRQGLAYFGGNTIATKAPGCITASGRETNDTGSCECPIS